VPAGAISGSAASICGEGPCAKKMRTGVSTDMPAASSPSGGSGGGGGAGGAPRLARSVKRSW
jgi:hypothetical protein